MSDNFEDKESIVIVIDDDDDGGVEVKDNNISKSNNESNKDSNTFKSNDSFVNEQCEESHATHDNDNNNQLTILEEKKYIQFMNQCP